MKYPWYAEATNVMEIEQGDIIADCMAILPCSEHYKCLETGVDDAPPLEIKQFNGVVLSQSCDIVNDKIDSLIVCPVISLTDLTSHEPYFRGSTARESLRQGKESAYHLLNKFTLDSSSEECHVVTFRHIYSIPKDFIKEIAKRGVRKKLLPPYREHLSQSFARYFMRVGLPVDILKEDLVR